MLFEAYLDFVDRRPVLSYVLFLASVVLLYTLVTSF